MESKAPESTVRNQYKSDDVKWCGYCQKDIPLDGFYKRSASPDGLSYKCKACSAAYSRSSYKPDEAKRRAGEWAKKNIERRREICRKSYRKNINSNRLKSSERQKRKRRLFPEKQRLIGRMAAAKRRTRLEAGGEVTPVSIVKLIIDMARNKCVYCKKPCQNLTLDHAQPLSKNGTNDWWNFVPCCKSCNCSKGNRDPGEWLYNSQGLNGLGEAILFTKAVCKAVKRLYPELHYSLHEKIMNN